MLQVLFPYCIQWCLYWWGFWSGTLGYLNHGYLKLQIIRNFLHAHLPSLKPYQIKKHFASSLPANMFVKTEGDQALTLFPIDLICDFFKSVSVAGALAKWMLKCSFCKCSSYKNSYKTWRSIGPKVSTSIWPPSIFFPNVLAAGWQLTKHFFIQKGLKLVNGYVEGGCAGNLWIWGSPVHPNTVYVQLK